MPAPQLVFHLQKTLLAQHSGRHSLQRVDQFCKLHGRQIFDEQMDVVVLPVRLDQHRAEIITNLDDRAKYPKFRKKFENESFRYPDPAQLKIEKDRIFLPKAGWVEMVMHREIVGTRQQRHRLAPGHILDVSIQVECEIDEPMLKIGAAEGVDAGVVHGAVLSDGTVFDLPRVSEKEQRQVAAIQKTVARRQKGSKNRMKAVRRLQSLQARHTRRRRDAKHKMTTAIIRSVAVLCVEDLRVKNMTASARGTVEEPGSNVAQKAGLNRSILDVSPGETRFQYEYKMKREGGRIVFVNPAFTSQQCCCCLHTDAENRPDRDTFVCVSCGYEDCADANAAKNIKRKGLEALVARTGGHPGLACELAALADGSRKKKAVRLETWALRRPQARSFRAGSSHFRISIVQFGTNR